MSAGAIELVLGPMFSGKSSELIRRARRYQHARKSVVVIKYARDVRYSDDSVSSHDKQMMKALGAVALSDVEAAIAEMKPDVIAVDEGQFFPDIVDFCEAQANAGRTVIVSALDGDFRRKPFGRILELVPMAERVDKLTAVCVKCCGDAAFTERTVASREIELIGAGDIYRPVCRKCFEDGALLQAQAQAPAAAVADAVPAAAVAVPATPAPAAVQAPVAGSEPRARDASADRAEAEAEAAASVSPATVPVPPTSSARSGRCSAASVSGGAGNSGSDDEVPAFPTLTPVKGTSSALGLGLGLGRPDADDGPYSDEDGLLAKGIDLTVVGRGIASLGLGTATTCSSTGAAARAAVPAAGAGGDDPRSPLADLQLKSRANSAASAFAGQSLSLEA